MGGSSDRAARRGVGAAHAAWPGEQFARPDFVDSGTAKQSSGADIVPARPGVVDAGRDLVMAGSREQHARRDLVDSGTTQLDAGADLLGAGPDLESRIASLECQRRRTRAD